MRPRSGLRSGASQVPAGTAGRPPRGTRAAKRKRNRVRGRRAGTSGHGRRGRGVDTATAPRPGWLPAGRQERGSGRESQGGEGPPPPLGCIRREGRGCTKEEFVHSGILVIRALPHPPSFLLLPPFPEWRVCDTAEKVSGMNING